eukprot:s5369_g1.t1
MVPLELAKMEAQAKESQSRDQHSPNELRVFVTSQRINGHQCAQRRARRLAKSSVRILRAQQGDPDVGEWLKMTELHLRLLNSVKNCT